MAQIVGQVELQVVPNDSTFNRDLQRIIDKAPKFAGQTVTPNINTAEFDAAAKNLTKTATAASDQATQALGNITPGMNTAAFQAQSNQVAEIADEAAARASSSFAKIAVGVGVGAAALYGLKAASDAVVGSLSKLFDNLLKAKAGFESILGQAEGSKLLGDIQEFARVTPFSTEGLVQYSQQLLGVGRAADSIIPTLSAVGDLVASKGGDSQTIGRVLFTLTQIQSVGRLIGQDAMQLQSALIPITKLLADSMGKTQAEIKALQAAGKISADTVFKTLEEAGLDVAGAMEGATRNIGGAKEALNDTIQILLQKSPVLIKINQDIVNAIKNLTNFLGSDRVSSVVADLSSGLAELYQSVQPLFGQLSVISGDLILTTLEAIVPLLQALGAVLNGIPVPVLTALGTFLAFNKFQTVITGFSKVTQVLNNFGGVIGRVSSGLGSATRAFESQGKIGVSAAATQAALIRTYQQTATAAAGATIQTEAYTAALRQQQAAAQAAGAGGFGAPTGPQIDPNTGRPINQTRLQRAGAALGGKGGAIAGVAGVAGVIGLSQRDNVDGNAGIALGVASTTATATALGFQVGGPYGAAIGAAAGLGFGIFQEFNKKAREDAAEKAKEWGDIGAKSAQAFTEGFARDFEVSASGATASERALKNAQIAADVATLEMAAKTGIVGPATKAAADRLGVELTIDTEKPNVAFTEDPRNTNLSNPAGLFSAGARLLGFGADPEKGEFIDRDAFGAQIKPLQEFNEQQQQELAKQRTVIAGIIGNPIASEWFDEFTAENRPDDLVGPFNTVEASVGSAFDLLSKFNIGVDEAVKLGEKVAFYFSDVLDSIQGSVDASFKWNGALEEAKATVEAINGERLKEANARLSQLSAEEEYTKRIKALSADSTPTQISTIAKDALSNAGSQAAFIGGSQEEIATNTNLLFAASIEDIQQQTGASDEALKGYLQTIGLYDDYLAATADKNQEIVKIDERIAVLRAQADADGGRSAGRLAAEITQLEKKKDELNGIVTAETLVDQARERRNAEALGNVKATEALQAVYSQFAATVVDGTVKLGQFGDAAQQAYGRAVALGSTPAEDNQIFVDSIENLQIALGLTDEKLLEYLDSVGLLDTYNKAVKDSTVGVAESVNEIATRYGYTNEELRTVLGLLDLIPSDVPIYLSVDATAALATLKVVDEEIARLQTAANDPNASGQERAAAGRAITDAQGRKTAAEETLAAAGVDVNATVGARELREKEIADKEAEQAAKDYAAAVEKAAREAEAWANKVNSAANSISSAMESAAQSIEDAAISWQASIKERVQFEDAVSVGRLTRNTQGQTDNLKELDAGLANLRGRGVSQEVLDSLGIDNVGDLKQVRKLVKANDSDLAALTQAVSQRDEASLAIAKNEEDKRTRENITTAIIAAAVTLGLDLSKDRASQISNQFTITPGMDVEGIVDQVLAQMSSGKIAR